MTDEIVYRVLDIDSTRAEDKTRTVAASLSSEEPIERFFGQEVLSHSPDAVDMTRAKGGLPLLFSHDPEQIVGVAEDIRVEDGRLRAKLRFATTAKANELWSLVRDGILKGVSIGYRILRMEQTDETEDGQSIFTAMRWQPLETSLVAVPADHSVGVGRSHPNLSLRGSNHMEISDSKLEKAERTGIFSENERIRKILAQAKGVDSHLDSDQAKRELKSMTESAIKSNMPFADYHQQTAMLLRLQPDPEPLDLGHPILDNPRNDPRTYLGLSKREIAKFSILKAANAMLTGDWRHAQLELECSRAVQDKLDRAPRGFFLPWDVQRHGQWQQRAVPMDTSEDSSLVATDHLSGNFIEALRPNSVALTAGARTLTGLVGNVSIPAFTTTSAFTWLAEDANSADTEPTSASVDLTPKTVSGSVPITRRLLKQSSPSIELLIRNDLLLGASVALDAAALAGTGLSNQPTGILSTTGVNTETITTAGQPSWANLVEFETEVATDNALAGSLAYVMAPNVIGFAKSTVIDSGSGRYAIEGNQCNGYRVYSTNNVGTNNIIFGNFSDLLLGLWGVTDINVDQATKAASGGLVLRAFLDCDVAVRHPQSFCINA